MKNDASLGRGYGAEIFFFTWWRRDLEHWPLGRFIMVTPASEVSEKKKTKFLTWQIFKMSS
jgi:hypothetical protein